MKRWATLFGFVFLSLFVWARVPKELVSMTYPPLGEIKTPKIHSFTLPNGLRVMVVEDHRLPLVAGRFMYRGGSVFDPSEKIGLANIATEVMRTGGTSQHTGDELDEYLESLSASIEAYAGDEAAYVSFNCLTENLDEILELYRQVIMEPVFDEEKLSLALDQGRSAIARRNDEARAITYREYPRILYGKDNPYARIEEYATLDAITREDCIHYHQRYLFPSNGILALWGDVNPKAIKKTLKKLFKDWKDAGRVPPAFPTIEYNLKPGIYFSEKEGINQSYFSMGHFGIQRDNPDYFALEVMNRIFGTGGFSSRLMKIIRAQKGLTYGIWGRVGWEYTHKGLFTVSSFTRSPKTVESLQAVMEEIKRMKEEGATEEELKHAKKAFLEKFVFNFDTTDKIVRQIQTFRFYGYPDDFLQMIKKKVEAVTLEDVNRVAKKYLDPDNLVIYVVGNPKEIDPPLSTLREVIPWDITIPEPKEKVKEATPEALEKGKALMEKVWEAHGGKALADVQAFQVQEEATLQFGEAPMQIHITTTYVLPDKVMADLAMPFGKMKQVYNGEEAWMQVPGGGVQPAPAKQFKEDMVLNPIILLKSFKEGKGTYQYLGTQSLGDKELEAVRVTFEEKGFTLYLDPENHRIRGVKAKKTTQMGPKMMTTLYEDYKTFQGVLYPVKATTTMENKPFSESMVKDLVFNPEIPEGAFVKPQ